ncbi:hypothetical protein E4U42_007510 [Claviceps africana]|uniref:Uncharacterized protein n=1 Tax=Claviceps africana TaxID=83212 RepID=A0A8K0J6Q5_9HYPO|nr:hypothetical protein E4U42_007510 [Claviceps africana]
MEEEHRASNASTPAPERPTQSPMSISGPAPTSERTDTTDTTDTTGTTDTTATAPSPATPCQPFVAAAASSEEPVASRTKQEDAVSEASRASSNGLHPASMPESLRHVAP